MGRPGLSGGRLPVRRPVVSAGCPLDPSEGRLQPSRQAVARPSFRPARRSPGRPSRSLAPGRPGRRLPACRSVWPTGRPEGLPESCVRPVRRTVARPPSRRVRRLPFGPVGGASPAVPSRGRPRFVPSDPPVARRTLSESRPRPSRRTVARPPFRPARRLPGGPSGGLPPALPTHGCPSVVPPNPPVARQVPWIPGPHVAISGGRGAAASKHWFRRSQTRAGGREPEGRRHEPFGCGPWRPRAPPATSVGRPVSLSTRGFPSRSARSTRRPPALSETFRPDASRTCNNSAEAQEKLQ